MGRKKEKKEIIQKIDETFEVKQKMPKEQKEKIYKRIFQEMLLACGIILYFIFLGLGFQNIEEATFLTDLKVFSIGVLIGAIVLFEYSYKKDDGKVAIYGIEVLVVAILTLASIYILDISKEKFQMILSIFSITVALYYLGKGIVIYQRMKKEYYKSLSDIKEIIKKEKRIEKNG